MRILLVPLLVSVLSGTALAQLFNPPGQQGGGQPFNPMGQIPGGSNIPFNAPNNYYFNMGPLYPFGPLQTKDVKLMDREAQTGRQVDLFTWFPYYGGKYNYTVLSVHGYIAFANILEDGLDFLIGEDVPNWPQNPDPAMIAIYTCRQKQSSAVPSDQTGVYYRLVFRRDMATTTNINRQLTSYQKRADYIDFNGDNFLDQIQYDLAQGMVGAKSFRPDAALVVTWQNMSYYQASSAEEMQKTATYQMVFATDRGGQLGYTMLNYHSLGYAGGDIYGNMKRGRCKAELNGGNQTGLVLVDPVYSKYPNKLYQMSSVPHIVGGRYLFRVDDIVRKGGCSNLTAGTYRLTIYPDIINMLGDVPIQVNGPCYQPNSQNPTLNIANYKGSQCIIKNPAIAECRMNQFYNWGSKNVYLDYNNNKAYVGSIYYVPVGLDPFGLTVDSIADWFKNPPPRTLTVRWYPGNFTDMNGQIISTLELTLYGYRESNDPTSQKYTNTLTPLCVIAAVQNSITNPLLAPGTMVQNSYQITVPLNPQWVGNGQSAMWGYSFGVLKLGVPVTGGSSNLSPAQMGQGIWSPPVPLQWLWLGTSGSQTQNPEDQRNYIANIAQKACINWFEEEGTQWNFIQDTETNASCPCTLNQAYADMGRFMPHPRCSQRFRQVGCDTFIGAKECFLSAENVISNFATHYGQVCCYDASGYLMQTTYASVQPDIVKGADRDPLPYNPGFPQRAYELGTYTYYKQYEAPTLSNYFHDVMPYYFCCKWAQNHCQFFYWRRPSSGCQEYRPAGIASVYGAGHFTTFDNVQYTFEGNGTYVYLHKNALTNSKNPTPAVLIEIRMERYPNRFVDFSHRNTYQYELMQPVNASVVTGVAVQEDGADRVVVMCRKDTRRMKYRTNVLVNDEIRYFDTMKMQRFEGFTMYINDVMEGQSEVYISLIRSRIGLRIRESYAYHIYQQQTFEESFGILDVTVSIPSEYFIRPDPINNQIDWYHAVEGLVGTYSNNTQDEFCDPKTNMPTGGYTNDQQASQWAKTWMVDNVQFQNLFTLMKAEHKEWPESALLNPIYKPAPEMEESDPFYPQYDNDALQRIQFCEQNPSMYNCPPPQMMKDLIPTCLGEKWCLYDYFFLQQKILAQLEQSEQSTGKGLRTELYAARNSCAAINIQYPEYLYIEPARGGYLGGDNVLFQCYQNGWLKGDAAYQCRDGQWNKGWQPWCRSRSLENTLRIVSVVFGILLAIAFLAALFACCFCFSKARREKNEKYNTGEPIPKKPVDDIPQPSTMIVTSRPNGFTTYNVPAPEYQKKDPAADDYNANLRVRVVDDVSQNSSPGSGRGNVTSV